MNNYIFIIVLIPILIIILLYQKKIDIEPTTDDLFIAYLKKHPDMCKFVSECKINDSLCHSSEHKKCETYLEKEWK